ncbi:MAG: hypothetical protein QXI51_06290 [Candidatus Korarchaeum sp.]
MEWVAGVEGDGLKAYSGYIMPEFPRVFLLSWRGEPSPHERKFLSVLLNVMSGFTLFTESKSLSYADSVRILQYISNSYVIPFRFILGTVRREEKEHTRPDVIGQIHRKLKIPLAILEEPTSVKYCFKIEECERDTRILAIAFSSLFSSPMRMGGEIRQVISQLLLSLLSEVKGEMLSMLIEDTYGWYARHVKAAGEALASELRYLAVSLEERNIKEQLKRISEVLGRDSLSERVKGFIDVFGEREFLIGRLQQILQLLQSIGKTCIDEFDHVLTVATGQWGIAQALLLSKMTGAKRITCLYTQNSLWARLFEEYCRKELELTCNCYPEIKYLPISATDAVMIERTMHNVLKSIDERTLVVAQGPASISIPLYVSGRKSKLSSVII